MLTSPDLGALLEIGGVRRAAEQPRSYDLNMEHGVWIKVIPLAAKGSVVPQHSHNFPHVTNLVRGSIGVWKDGVFDGNRHAPCGILITARVKHTFLNS